tara:strand:+ start:668 stop:1462 length:795 start_codon:yes stop_codon:yes gene_type:complete
MKISGISDIIPDPNGVADLGDSSNRFGNFYMDDDKKIEIGTDGDFINFDSTNNKLQIETSSVLEHKIGSSVCLHTQANTAGGNNTIVAINGATIDNTFALKINGNTDTSGYTNSTSYFTFSDDRLKENEILLTNATSTLQKLKPQLYDRKPSFTDTDTSTWESQAGLIAQEIYYQAPELRNILKIGEGGNPAENITIPDDPSIDPDYSSWGDNPASINYTGLIPYLIKSIQELKTTIDSQHTVINSQQTTINDLTTRVQTLEGN